MSFDGANVSSGQVDFDGATFSGGQVSFRQARFAGAWSTSRARSSRRSGGLRASAGLVASPTFEFQGSLPSVVKMPEGRQVGQT